MILPTGVAAVDAVISSSETTRQAACNVAGASQSTQNAAYVTMYRAVLAAKLAAGVDPGNEIIALENLGQTV